MANQHKDFIFRFTWLSALFLALKGALIGTGAILPGVSGGVLCVALGVYQPLMALLAHPWREFGKRWLYFLPLLFGFALGVMGLSRLVAWLFQRSPVPAVWLFIGLILGTMPALWRESGRSGRTKSSWMALGIAFALMLIALLLLKSTGTLRLKPSPWLWALCGVLWAVGFIAPGMSPSSLFILMDVYEPMTAGIARLDMAILLPMCAGLIAGVLLLSRIMNRLLARRHGVTMHAILGISVASTVVIVPWGGAQGFADALIYVLCFLIGLLAALWMDKINLQMEERGEKT